MVTLFFGYAVAAGFMVVYDMAIDTVLVCYVTVRHDPPAGRRVRLPRARVRPAPSHRIRTSRRT